jgi:NAD+ synthase (glutamine-hydrolysing)
MYHFLRVATAVPTVKVSDIDYNLAQHLDLIRKAASEGVQLLVFPELSITGYTCADLFRQPTLLEGTRQALDLLCEATHDLSAMIVVGAPVAWRNHVYNCAVVLQYGEIRAYVPKVFLPNYNEFYETRWFDSGASVPADTYLDDIPFGAGQLFSLNGAIVGIEICEDLWVPVPPSSIMALRGAQVIVNLSASDEVLGKHAYLRRMIEAHSGRLVAAYVYAACGFGESSTDLVFAGKGIIAENGGICGESERFLMENQLLVRDLDIEKLQTLRRDQTTYTELPLSLDADGVSRGKYITNELEPADEPDWEDKFYRHVVPTPFVPSDETEMSERCNEIFNIQVSGLVTRLRHINCQTAVIGISGGLDSTLALLVTIRAFDKLGWDRKRIVGITMPGFGTTKRTHNNSLGLMESLGITLREISIVPSVTQHFADLGIDANVHDVTYENCQARERTQILMDAANQTNGIVIGTGDLSELALGWCTYNGDHMSMYAVNVSIPKTLVKYLVRWVAMTSVDERSRDILLDIFDTPISPELTPPDAEGKIAQKTEDLVGPYELHDFFLYHFFRFGASPSKIYFLARKAFDGKYDNETILKWLRTFFRRFFQQQFKRSCLPDGPKVGTVSLSPRGDWRMPSDASWKTWNNELETIELS